MNKSAKKKIIFLMAVLACIMSSAVVVKVAFFSGESENTSDGKKDPKPSSIEKQIDEFLLTDNYAEAINAVNLAKDKEITESVTAKIHDIIKLVETSAMKQASEKIKQYDYVGAEQILLAATKQQEIRGNLYTFSEEFTKMYANSQKFSTVVEYNGAVEHLFFHPLIAYPELAFDGDYKEKGLDDYFATVPEFKEVLRQLYEKNYILIDIALTYSVGADGVPVKQKLMLPEGKKPVIISIDDLNFYDYMKEHGMPHGYLIDESGKLMTYSDRPDGSRDISDDNDILPIMEKFCAQYPDFSWGGARGIIASTGYDGTLGIRTDELDAPDYAARVTEATVLADKVKQMGWTFASHSYGHGSPAKQTDEKLMRDCDNWLAEVTPIVGQTNVYIYPYGELIKTDSPKHQYLVSQGFKMFCGVQSKSAYLKFYPGSVLMQRRNIDGISLKSGNVGDMFDISKILDPLRPQ